MSDYKPDQDTQLEILEEWPEPEEYDHDDCWHDEIARDDFYNPNRRVSKIKNDNSKQRKANNRQLVNTQNQINTIQPSSSIIDIDQINEDTNALFYATFGSRNVSADEKIDNPNLSNKEKTKENKTNTEKDKDLVMHYLKQNNFTILEQTNKYPNLIFIELGSCTKMIQVVCPDPNRKITNWLAVNADKWYPADIYVYVGMDSSSINIIKFAHPDQFCFHEKDPEDSEDQRWFDDTYRVPIRALKDTNQLFEMLEKEAVNSVSTGTAPKPADKIADLDYAYLMLFNEIEVSRGKE